MTQYTTATVSTGNQKVTLEVPNTGICLAPPAELKVGYQSTTVNGSKGAKLTFLHATLTVDGKLRATAKQTSGSFKLSLRGLKKGTYTLKVISTYHYKVGKKTKTLARTQNVKFKVC